MKRTDCLNSDLQPTQVGSSLTGQVKTYIVPVYSITQGNGSGARLWHSRPAEHFYNVTFMSVSEKPGWAVKQTKTVIPPVLAP